MSANRRLPLLVSLLAIVLVAGAIAAITRLYRGDAGLLRAVTVSDSRITPNADGDSDITRIAYELTRRAAVSIYFEDGAGERYYFRRDRDRGPDSYTVQFSGVVEGYVRPDEAISGTVLARLLPDGDYTLVIEAIDERGRAERITRPLTVADADTTLPDMRGFQIFPQTFTPNRDGIDDRVTIQFDLQKSAQTRVFLRTADGAEIAIQELPRGIDADAPGRHIFDYEGGVDRGVRPQPDGTYPVIAVAEDAEGQRVQVAGELTIRRGGLPRAEIVSPASADTLQFSTTAVALCDTIFFTVTVRNYGDAPIRTTGPEPGTVYDSDWNYNTLGWNTESGAWRVAIGYENEITNYPYRWSLGRFDELTAEDGFYYLEPGQTVVVTGGIRVVGPLGVRNPQPMWAGLIHEDVEISQFNNRVDPKSVVVDLPAGDDAAACAPREVPIRPNP